MNDEAEIRPNCPSREIRQQSREGHGNSQGQGLGEGVGGDGGRSEE